jgi:SAM-dependent methyltransferase
MRWAGFEAIGLELSPWVVEFARKTFDVPIYCGPVERQDFAPGSFDAIALLNVLEHLPDPISTLTLCMRLLAPDGMLMIETPHFNDERAFTAMRASGARILSELRPVEHMHLFSEPALRLLLERLGCHWIQSLPIEPFWSRYKKHQFFVAGRQPSLGRPPAAIADALSRSTHGRMIQGLLDLKHYLEQTHMELGVHRAQAAQRLRRACSPLSVVQIQNDAIATGQGWYPIEYYNRETFRWVANDAELIIHRPSASRRTLSLEMEPGPGVGSQPFTLQVLDEQGRVAATAEVKGRQVVNVALPISQGQTAVFRLHIEGGGLPTPNDPRTLNFRIFRFGWSDCEPRSATPPSRVSHSRGFG